MIGSVYLFEDNLFLKIVSVTFSVLIFVEILNVYTEIKEFHWFMGLALIGTAVTYSLTLIFFKSILDVVFIFEPYIIWRIAVIALACWAPFFLLSKVKRKCFPEEYEKLNISNRK
jgi:phospholipid-translocating ATPase